MAKWYHRRMRTANEAVARPNMRFVPVEVYPLLSIYRLGGVQRDPRRVAERQDDSKPIT